MDKENKVFVNADIITEIEGGEKTVRKVGKVFKDSDNLKDVLIYFSMEVFKHTQEMGMLYGDKYFSVELESMNIHSYAYEK